MESEVFAHKLTQKPRHCSEGNINSLGCSWKFNSGKTEHMFLISWLPWLTIAWQSEEATKTTALNSDQQGSKNHLRRQWLSSWCVRQGKAASGGQIPQRSLSTKGEGPSMCVGDPGGHLFSLTTASQSTDTLPSPKGEVTL